MLLRRAMVGGKICKADVFPWVRWVVTVLDFLAHSAHLLGTRNFLLRDYFTVVENSKFPAWGARQKS